VRDRLRLHLESTNLIPPGSRILVAYSGGPDSTCLVHVLHALGYDLVAAYLHHGQRSEADKEMALCAAFADELGVPFVSGRADVPRMAEDLKIGIEEAGRKARYEFLRQAAHRLECDLIATGHTLDDHVETVVFNLTRGAGMAGLAGIPDSANGIVRPLLKTPRAETQEYCQTLGLWTAHDPANDDVRFSRVRVRRNVLPELALINPDIRNALDRTAELMREEDAFLNAAAAAALEQCEIPLNGDLGFLTQDVEMAFHRQRLSHLPPVLYRRALRLAAKSLGASLDHQQTQALADGARLPTGSVTSDDGAVTIAWNEDRYHVYQVRPNIPFRFNLTVPGETISDEFGWQFTAYEEPAPDLPPRREALAVHISLATLKGTLHFRTAGTGDQMQPIGFSGRRSLADLLGEAKLTTAARTRLPIVADMVGILWAPGVCLDERARVAAGEPSLRIEFEPISGSSMGLESA